MPENPVDRFASRPVRDDNDALTHDRVRVEFQEFARMLNLIVPESREKSLMWTYLEQSLMWGNKAIASRRPTEEELLNS